LDGRRIYNMIQVEGRNPVYEALKAHRAVKLMVAREVEKEKKVQLIIELSKAVGVSANLTSMAEINGLSETGRHQGVIAYVKPSQIRSLEEIVEGMSDDSCLLLLEQVQDPQNLGAILRTAESAAVCAVVVPKHGSVELTPAVHRVSMGGSLHVPFLRENLHSAAKLLQQNGIRVIGVDPTGPKEYFSENLTGAVAFVLGGENRGISPSLLEKCDNVVRIPMRGKIESLNVSVSTALILYERLRQQTTKNATPESDQQL
jgi:23S rRNA (guanosine2251-2'-O)-methyltransferase